MKGSNQKQLNLVIAIIMIVTFVTLEGIVTTAFAGTVPLSANENKGREVTFGGKQWIIIAPLYKHIMLKNNDGNKVRAGIESYLQSQFFDSLGEDKKLVDGNGVRVPLQSYVIDPFGVGNGIYPQRSVSWWIDFWSDGIPVYVDQNSNFGGAQDPNEQHAVFPVASLVDGVFVESGGKVKAVSVPTFSSCTLAGDSLETATITCTVTFDGGDPVTEKGIVYAPHTNPTLSNRSIPAESGSGEFTVALSSLDKHSIYHLRSYAKNVAGTAYGNDIEFASGVQPDKTHIYVTPTGNDIDGCGQVGDEYATIGKALEDVDENGTVHVFAGTYPEHLTISRSVTLIGAGRNDTTIDGTNSGRVFYLEQNITVSIEGVTIRNGKAADGIDYIGSYKPTDGEPGGGIYNKATLTLTDCLITLNFAGHGGYGEFWSYDGTAGGAGGGIFNDGYLTLVNSTISSNQSGNGGEGYSAGGQGGAAGPGGDGGGIYNNQTLIVLGCTILDNYARPGGWGMATWGGDGEDGSGGGIYNNGTMSVTNSSVWSNKCDGNGKNIYNAGAKEVIDSSNNWWGSNNGPYAEINSIFNLLVQKWIVMTAVASDDKIPAGGSTTVLTEFKTNNYSEETAFEVDNIKVDFTAAKGSLPSPEYTIDGVATATYTADGIPESKTIAVKAANQEITVNVLVDTFVIKEDLPTCVLNIPYSANFTGSGGSQPYTWSASGLPDGLILDSLSGEISGSPLQDGNFEIELTVTDSDGESASINYSLNVELSSGNGGYLVTPVISDVYSFVTEKTVSMIVNDNVTGFQFFVVEISPVLGHDGDEIAVFTHNRNGIQVGINAINADFEIVNSASAGFNVQPGDIINVFIVDKLPIDTNSNPSIL